MKEGIIDTCIMTMRLSGYLYDDYEVERRSEVEVERCSEVERQSEVKDYEVERRVKKV